MRGEYCIGGASFFTLAAAILMIFVHIGQINPGSLPKMIDFVSFQTGGLGTALASTRMGTPSNLYASGSPVAALGTGSGIKTTYKWGQMNLCGYDSNGRGACANAHFGQYFTPAATLLADSPSRIVRNQITDFLPANDFSDADSTKRFGLAAFWCIFIGSCAALLAFIFGVIPTRFTFLIASFWSIVSALGLVIGASIWTSLFVKIRAVEHTAANVATGITVKFGNALILTWVAFALVSLSIIPYLISTCTYRRKY